MGVIAFWVPFSTPLSNQTGTGKGKPRRMNKFIVDLVNFFQKSTNLRLDLRLDLRLELLREMVDSSGPDSNKAKF